MGSWRALEHTADLALEARGETAGEALEQLCLGLMNQVTDPSAVRPAKEVAVEAAGIDRAETIVSALGELLYRVNVGGWVFAEFHAREVGDTRIRLAAMGELRDPSRHPFEVEIKAATYHDLVFQRCEEDGGWVIRVVFDV